MAPSSGSGVFSPRRRRAGRGATAAAWFHQKFFEEVSGHLVMEKVYKRQMRHDEGGGPPDTQAMRAARHNIRYHLAYIGWLMRTGPGLPASA